LNNCTLRRLAPAPLGARALLGTVLVGTASAAHVGCGQTITQSTVLDTNVGPCSGEGILIGADNITLDLNGFAVFGISAPGEGPGILLDERTAVTVRNGTVRLFDAGVAPQSALHQLTGRSREGEHPAPWDHGTRAV
jgi:hypothetical protein